MYEEKIINFKSTNSCKSIAEFTVALLSFFFFFYHVLSRSVASNSFATSWMAARQAPRSIGILQARILEWVAMPLP